MLKEKKVILDKEHFDRVLKRMAHEIIEHNRNLEDIILIGIHTRGYPIAKRIKEFIKTFEAKEILIGSVDITLYRDDLSLVGPQPIVHKSEIPFNIDGKIVILVDDVLYTGRTVRAAIDAVLDYGRPKQIQLLELVDRGHRELPIKANYVGKDLPTSFNEVVKVMLEEIDGEDKVVLCERTN